MAKKKTAKKKPKPKPLKRWLVGPKRDAFGSRYWDIYVRRSPPRPLRYAKGWGPGKPTLSFFTGTMQEQLIPKRYRREAKRHPYKAVEITTLSE